MREGPELRHAQGTAAAHSFQQPLDDMAIHMHAFSLIKARQAKNMYTT